MRSFCISILVCGAVACSGDTPGSMRNDVAAEAGVTDAGSAGHAAAGSGASERGAGASAAGAGAQAGAGASGSVADAGRKPEPEAEPEDDAGMPADAGKPTRYDYVNHVQPILKRYCTGCHGPSGLGPFVLDSYEAARAAAAQAAGAISSGIMPPCEDQPPGGCSRPTVAETAVMIEWAESSRPERL